MQLEEVLKNAFRQADNWVHMNMRAYLERQCQDQWECGDVSLKALILSYNNICLITIGKAALAVYLQVSMLLGALPRELMGKAVMKLELESTEPSRFKYDKLRKNVLDECVTANTLALLDSDRAHTVLGVSPYSVPAGVALPQMPLVTNLPVIPSEQTPAPAQATDGIPIAKPDNTIDTRMDIMMKTFKARTFQMRTAND